MRNLKFILFILLWSSMVLYSCTKNDKTLPVADFSANVTNIMVDSSVSFTDESTGNPTSWSWSFPGGTPSSSTVKDPRNIQYHTAGIYNVTLTVTNADGNNSKTKTTYIVVTATPPQLPVVSTTVISGITNTTAISGGTVTSQGSSAVTTRGICWSTSSNPTVANSKTSDGSGMGLYISNISGLLANTVYHVRAYAVNGAGTVYGDDVSFTTTQPKLYVCGTEWSSTETMQRAKLWVNGTGAFLGDNIESFAQGMTVTDAGDVYVAGSVKSSNWRAVYWDNNGAHYLTYTNGSTYAVANAIFVSNNDIYAAGYETNTAGKKVAKYWKNGTAVSLSDGTYNAEALSIVVSGADVYVVGYEFNSSGITNPVYWKNGVENSSIVYGEGSATSVSVSGSNIYVAGEMNPGTFAGGAVYWKNGDLNYLTANTQNIGSASSIFLSGTDVYIAGYNSAMVATYWKNGMPSTLETSNSYANSIFVAGNDIYVAGKTASGDVCYWKNGTRTILSVTNNTHNKATGIVYK